MAQHQVGPWDPLASAALWVSGLSPELPKLEDWPGLACFALPVPLSVWPQGSRG